MKRNLSLAFLLLVAAACTPSPEPQAVAESGRVDSADGVPIRYRVQGEGSPAVIFVHGWTAHQGNWESQVKHFAESHTVVTLDLGGHGESGRGRASWTVPAFGEDVAAVVTALDLDEVVLVGHSLGGPVVVAAAALMPERVIGVVGVDTLKNAGDVYTEEFVDNFLSQFDGDFDTAYADFIRSQFLPNTDPAVIEDATAGLPAAQPEDALEMLALYFQWLREDFAETLQEIEAPVYCINSDRSPTDVEGIRAFAPSFKVLMMPGTSHFPMIDDPVSFNQHLKNIIQSVTN